MLSVEQLRVRFAQNVVVRDLDLTIPDASFVGLVGESGSGKSVTCLSIMRLTPADVTGRIVWKSRDLEVDLLKCQETELRTHRGSLISYVFQDPSTSLNPLMTIGQQIHETFLAHFPGTKKEALTATMEQLRAVHLSDPERVYRSFPHELSGGMKQRAMIAMALVAKPRLLIADEPTTALDSVSERGILELLKELQRARGLSVLFVTHHLALAKEFCDAITILKRGEVVGPESDYAKSLFKASLMGVKPRTLLEV